MNAEKQYILAFNNGYILEQYEPEFLNIVSKTLVATNNYLQGFLAGKEQLDLEYNKDRLSELQQLRYQSQNKEKGFSRDE